MLQLYWTAGQMSIPPLQIFLQGIQIGYENSMAAFQAPVHIKLPITEAFSSSILCPVPEESHFIIWKIKDLVPGSKIQKISKNSAKIQMGKCRSRKNAGTPYKWEEPAGMSHRPSMKKCIKVWYLVTDNRIQEKCDESLESL